MSTPSTTRTTLGSRCRSCAATTSGTSSSESSSAATTSAPGSRRFRVFRESLASTTVPACRSTASTSRLPTVRSDLMNVATWRSRAVLDRARAGPIWWETTAVLATISVAAVFRLQDLSRIPYGITGDEAIFGLEGRRILEAGPIGPYSPFAAGQPAGMLYAAAGSISAFGSTIFAIRLVPAVAGVLTVIALYVYGRRNFGVLSGVLAAALLALSSWHIGISRFAV